MSAQPLEFGVVQTSHSRMAQLASLLTWRRASGWPDCRVLEVGSYEGASALSLSAFIGAAFPAGGSVLCVDPWQPYHTPEQIAAGHLYLRMDEELRSGLVFERFKRNAASCHPRAPISYLRGTLGQVKTMFDAAFFGAFDLIFIDGDHTYNSVRRDILEAMPMVRDGGLLCGDDFEMSFAPEEADYLRGLASVDYHEGSFHPGVSLAILELFDNKVWRAHGIWAVLKAAGGWSPKVVA